MSGETSLSDVLSDSPAVETQEVEQQEQGVEESATPADRQEVQEPQDEDPIDKHRKGLEAGIAAERTKRQAAERELAEARARLQQVQQPRQQTAQREQPDLTRPKRDEFQSQEEYEDALLDYGDRRRDEKEKQTRAQREAQEHEEQMQRTADDVIARGKEAFEDFDQVINSGLGPFLAQETPHAGLFRSALLTGDRAHEVAYYLGKNREEAQRIYSMQPLQMVRAVALIEATKLDAAAEPQKQVTTIPRTLTQARDARGQFKAETYDGPTPLDQVLAFKK